jgi:hypothetical protein
MDVGELTEFNKRLHVGTQHVGKLTAVHVATQRVNSPNLTSHFLASYERL